MQTDRFDKYYKTRAKRSEQVTAQQSAERLRRLAAQTHEALQQFEDRLRAEQEEQRTLDEIPIEADAMQHPSHRNSNLIDRGPHRDVVSASTTGDFGHPGRSHSEPNFSKDSKALNSTSAFSKTAGVAIWQSRRAKKPPSPLTLYDYGCISPRPKSVFAQRQERIGGSVKSPFRQSCCSNVYFPGAEFKQGIYGDKLQDPCLLPPMSWKQRPQLPLRYTDDAGDRRPGAAQALQPHLRETFSSPSVPVVRLTTAHEQRSRLVMEAIDKQRKEAVLEQIQYEGGVFAGNWADPLLENRGVVPEPLKQVCFAWLAKAAEAVLSGFPEDRYLSPRRADAARLVIGLDETMRRTRSRLADLFVPGPHSVPFVLEAREFLQGVFRTGALPEGSLTEDSLTVVMSLLDPAYNGRVSLLVLGRAIAAVNARLNNANADVTMQGGVMKLRPAALDSHGSYGQTLPVIYVKLEAESRSIFDFERSFDKFRAQQRVLLGQHSEIRGLAGRGEDMRTGSAGLSRAQPGQREGEQGRKGTDELILR